MQAAGRAQKTMGYWVSITGLDLKHWSNAPKFWWYTMPAMMSAKSAPGNVYAEGNNIDGTHHTLSAWDDRESMLRFMRGTNHVAAMRALDSIATGKVYGYESDAIPSWSEAREMYDLHGRVVGAAGREIQKKEAEAKREAEVANTGEQDEEEEGGGKEAGGSES